ncbi:MAG: GxxExxY protein [Chloroflexi bacterium]|nr:GxxExxY protein [Chloroflexota bacterium]
MNRGARRVRREDDNGRERAVDALTPVHEAQLLSYLKLSGCKVGLLINFNVKLLKNGIRRIVNDFPDSL